MEDVANAAIEAALKVGAKFADVRIENTTTTIIELSDGVTKRSIASRLKGAGIRAFIDGAWAFGQATDLTPEGMRETGESVARLALATRSRVAKQFEIDGPSFQDKVRLKVRKPLQDITFEEKIAFAKMIDDQARDFDGRVHNTRTVYGDLWTELYIANSLGTSVRLENSLPTIVSITTAKDGANRQRGYKLVSTRGGFEELETERPQHIGEESAKLAVDLLSSVAATGGTYDVVLDPVLNGVMIHEAFGHASEADNWPAHTTILEDKVGEMVGPEHLNLTDDPTLPGMRGSFEYDWEGTRTRKRALVKDGVLTDLLHSLETAVLLDMESNGSARAQSFMYPPLPRMSNTFMEPGDWDTDELISDTNEGLLLCGFNYGYTVPSKGQFMFQANYGYLIENGELTKLVRDVSMAGQILEVLAKIDAIGKDFSLESGTCGKSGQAVPEMAGGPHARIQEIPVGGV